MSPRPHNKLDRHLGTRGWILRVCAWVWGLIGQGILPQAAKTGEPSLLHLYMPVPLQVTLRWAPAMLAIYGAPRRKHLPVVTAALIIAREDTVSANTVTKRAQRSLASKWTSGRAKSVQAGAHVDGSMSRPYGDEQI